MAIDKKHCTDMLAFGESYMNGLWDAEDLEETLFQMIRDRTIHKMSMRRVDFDRDTLMDVHYNLGNDLFEAITGPSLCYTSGRWEMPGDTLEIAQRRKFANIVQKLELKSGMTVLDIGCGWGAFGKYCNGQGLDVSVTGVTLSEEQAKVAGRYCHVHIRDYRDAPAHWRTGQYDRVISLGMLEHVGCDQYREYHQAVHRYLKPDGIHLLEVTGHNASHRMFNPWINKYIAPGGMLPSLAQLCKASERLFVIEDIENYALHYVPTLRAWWKNICEAKDRFDYDERFWRMWEFYLLGSAAALRSRHFQHYQIIQTKGRLNPPKRV